MNGRPELGGSCHGKKELNRDVGGVEEVGGFGGEEGLNADDAKSATKPGHSDAKTPQRAPSHPGLSLIQMR